MSKRGEKLDMFGGGNDLQSVSDEIYGGSDIPDSGRVVARPTPINQIWADPKQPRRAIPLSIRLHWDGNPDSVPDLLNDWRMVAQQMIGDALDMVKLLNGEGEGLDSDKFPSVAQEFYSLARLAANIKRDGLINPITVIESDDKLVIESGERRWLAYHLLNMFAGDEWSKIPAAKGKSSDSVWRQATENTARRQLNAIGMARQIGLLIMAARGTPPLESGQQYKDYDEIVTNGVSDRRFYAQVADGNVHRIPKGMGERIQAAMGLGMEQISQYRNLLRLTNDELVNDVLWTRADIENWPEGWLREIRTLTPVKVSEVLQRSEWTIDDLRALKDAPPPQRLPVTTEWMNKRVMTQHGLTGTVVDVNGEWIVVAKDGTGQRYQYAVGQLTILADRPGAPPVVPAPKPAPQIIPQAAPAPTVTFEVGDTVKTRLGNVGTVTAVNGRMVSLHVPHHGNTTQYADQLTLVKKADAPQLDENDIEPDADPDAFAPPREYSEGWTDGEGGVNFRVGDKVKTVLGQNDGVVLEMDYFGRALIQFHDGQFWKEAVSLILVERPEASDKADSQPQRQPKLLFPIGSQAWGFLDALNDLAIFADDDDINEMLDDLVALTDVEAIRLHDAQALKPKLDEAYEQLKGAMEQWLMVNFADILRKVMDAAQ